MWTCWHVLICADMCRYVPTCADMGRHVPTYSITLGTSDTNHLELTCMLACVSTFGHALICADMGWYVLTCANMYHHSRHLWCKPFGPYLHAGTCQHIWTCRHVLICTDMCQHVASLSAPLIPTIWTLPPCWYVSAHVYMPICADITLGTYDTNHLDMICIPVCVSTCGHADTRWYVLTCADMCQHVTSF